MTSSSRILHTANHLLASWGKGVSLALAGLALATGCESLEKYSAKEGFNMGFLKKKEPPVQIVSTWKPEVIFVPDPANQGNPNPGLAGRIYLFQSDLGKSTTCEGKLDIDLYDLGVVNGGAPVHLERWEYDSASLAKLIRKDPIGDGYTVFLPWGSYRSDIQKIQLKLRFDHGGSFPIYADTGPITLNGPLKVVRHDSSTFPEQFGSQPSAPPPQPMQPRMMLDPNAGRPETPLRQIIPRPEHPLMNNQGKDQQLPPPRLVPGQNQPMNLPSPGANPGRMELPAPRNDGNTPFLQPNSVPSNSGGLNTPGAAAPSGQPVPQQLPDDPSQSKAGPGALKPAAPRLDLLEPNDPSLVRRSGSSKPETPQKVWTLR
jgi:hypothetical protein